MPASSAYAVGGRFGAEPLGCLPAESAVALDHGPDRELELAPPLDVGEVAERAAHRDARALVHLRQVVGDDRDLDPEDRRGDGGAEQRLVALVVRVGDQRHDGGDQLGPGRLDPDGSAVDLSSTVEGDPVVVAGVLLRLQLGLGDRGLEGDVPERGGLLQVGLVAGQVAQERALRGDPAVLADGAVQVVPVDGQPDLAEERLERHLVLGGEALAELDEVLPPDRHLPLGVGLLRRGEVGVVGDRRVAADAEEVLHPALGGQAVVVPADRVEDRLAPHPLVAGDQVLLRVGADAPEVQRAGGGRRRRVDRVDLARGSWSGRRRRSGRSPTAWTTCPRDPPAPACPVRRRPAAAASYWTGASGSRSWPKSMDRRPGAENEFHREARQTGKRGTIRALEGRSGRFVPRFLLPVGSARAPRPGAIRWSREVGTT